jgi:hypothetical protein
MASNWRTQLTTSKMRPTTLTLSATYSMNAQFLMKTLEMFGLPEDYLAGNGHWSTWSKESAEGKDKKKGKGKKDGKKKFQHIAKKLGVQKEELKRPTHFDLAPF